MRKLCEGLARYGLVMVSCLVVSRAVNHGLLEFHQPVWPTEVETLVVGDSHVAMGIDPRLMSNGRNIAQPSEPMVATHLKVAHVMTAVPGLRTVVVGFAPHNLATYNDRKFEQEPWAHELLSRYYGLFDPTRIDDLALDSRAYLSEQVRALWTPNMHLIGDGVAHFRGIPREDHPFRGGFLPRTARDASEAEFQETISRHFQPDDSGEIVSSLQRRHLLAMIDELTGEGVRVLLVATPTSARYRAEVPSGLQSAYREVCRAFDLRSDVRCLDLTAATGLDFFSDWDHLSQSGAASVTRRVAAAASDLIGSP